MVRYAGGNILGASTCGVALTGGGAVGALWHETGTCVHGCWTISVSLLAMEELVMGWATVSWATMSWAVMDLGHRCVGPQWVWPQWIWLQGFWPWLVRP